MKKIMLTTALLCACAFASQEFSERIDTVALFKNGNGFFMSTLDIAAGSEGFVLYPQAAPTHGSFWASWYEGMEVDYIVCEEVDYDEPIEALTISELLAANVGTEVRLAVREEYITGKILSVETKRSDRNPQPYAPGKDEYIPNITYEILTLQTAAGIAVLNAQQIQEATFLSDDINRSGSKRAKRISLNGKFSAPVPAAGAITLRYLAKGIAWVPSYIVDISDKEKAVLTAKTLIINEAADLDNTRILLITGYPQLEFAHIYSPVSMKNTLAEFLAALDGGAAPRYGLTTNLAKSRDAGFGIMAEAAAPISYGGAAEGRQVEDMFFYPLENVTLKKNQTGYYPLFSLDVDCRHIHSWDVADNIDRYSRYSSTGEQEQVVWHCIRLKNSSKQPWTAAAIQTIKDDFILGQSELPHTLAGDDATVKITKAAEVKANQVEYVAKRVPNSATFFGVTYDEVTIEAILYIDNTKSEDIEIEVSKSLTGELISCSPKAQTQVKQVDVGSVNETRELKWSIPIEAGKQQQIKYTYKAYLRR